MLYVGFRGCTVFLLWILQLFDFFWKGLFGVHDILRGLCFNPVSTQRRVCVCFFWIFANNCFVTSNPFRIWWRNFGLMGNYINRSKPNKTSEATSFITFQCWRETMPQDPFGEPHFLNQTLLQVPGPWKQNQSLSPLTFWVSFPKAGNGSSKPTVTMHFSGFFLRPKLLCFVGRIHPHDFVVPTVVTEKTSNLQTSNCPRLREGGGFCFLDTQKVGEVPKSVMIP